MPLVLLFSVMLLASDHSCNFGPAVAMPLPHFYFNVVIEYGSARLGFGIDASTAAVVSIKAGGAVDLYNASAQTKIAVGDRIRVANGVAIKTARDLQLAIKPFHGTFVGRMRRTHWLTQAVDAAGQVANHPAAPQAVDALALAAPQTTCQTASHPVVVTTSARLVPPPAAVDAMAAAAPQTADALTVTALQTAGQVANHLAVPQAVDALARAAPQTTCQTASHPVVVTTSAPPAPSHPVAAGMVPPPAAVEAAPQASGQARRHRSFASTSAPQVKLLYLIPFEDALEKLRGLSEKPLPNGTQLRTRNGCTINLYWRGGMSIGGPELSRPEGLELVKGWTVPHGKRKCE